jgi:hypothetical protein
MMDWTFFAQLESQQPGILQLAKAKAKAMGLPLADYLEHLVWREFARQSRTSPQANEGVVTPF